jgi:thioredoxin reductase
VKRRTTSKGLHQTINNISRSTGCPVSKYLLSLPGLIFSAAASATRRASEMYTVSSTKFDDLPGNLPEDRVPHDLDPQSLVDLSQFVKRALEDLRADVLVADALWRDLLAMTGRVQTLSGASNIPQNWSQNSTERHPTDISANDARVSRVAPGSSWVDVPFTFSTKQNRGLAGRCSGTASLIPDNDGKWKMWVLTTVLENFEGHGSPDIPQLKKDTTNGHSINGAQSNLNHETSVVIIGAGQNGLSLAGRLGALGIDYILLERERDVGLSWTNKYESIKQHTNKESNNLPFDRTWKADDPDLLVGAEVAVGFQNYVKRYGINVWTSTVTKDCTWNEQQSGWTLIVERGASVERHTISTRHLGLAMGAGLSIPYVPEWPGAETYKGQLVHASDYKTSRAWKGKTAVVVGCGTTAHDVAQDMLNAGLSSITLTQRSKTSVYPVEWIVKGLGSKFHP